MLSKEKQLSAGLQTLGHAVSGGAAGVFVKFLLFPLDTMQVRKSVSSGRILTMRDVASDLLHLRNLDDIFRGCEFGMIRAATFHGVFFGFYQALKDHWLRANPGALDMPPLVALFRGSAAGILTQLVAIPLAVVETRLMSSDDKNDSALSVARDILRRDGLLGFWNGFLPSVILVVNPAIVFYFYSRLVKILGRVFGEKSAIVAFLAGGLSKAIATVLCYPLMFVKTLLMAGTSGIRAGANAISCVCYGGDDDSSCDEDDEKSPDPGDDDYFFRGDVKYSIVAESDERSTAVPKPQYNEGRKTKKKKTTTTIQKPRAGRRHVSFSEQVEEADVVFKSEESSSGSELFVEGERFQKAAVIHARKRKLKTEAAITETPGFGKGGRSMLDVFNDTMRAKGLKGLYRGMGTKIIHAALTYAFLFSSKEALSKLTFALLILLSGRRTDAGKRAVAAL